MTYTYVVLEVSTAAYDEIAEKLRAAGYDHALAVPDQIIMHGIALERGAIAKVAGVRGAHPIVEGTRIGVHDVIGLLQNGETAETVISRCFPDLTPAQVSACVAYYDEHRAEIDELIRKQTAPEKKPPVHHSWQPSDYDWLLGALRPHFDRLTPELSDHRHKYTLTCDWGEGDSRIRFPILLEADYDDGPFSVNQLIAEDEVSREVFVQQVLASKRRCEAGTDDCEHPYTATRADGTHWCMMCRQELG